MNPPFSGFLAGARCLGLGLGSLLLAAAPWAHATSYTISDGGSSASIDVNSSAGMYNWSVSDMNQLKQQWFWYRVGNGPEASIDSLPFVSATLTGNNILTSTYDNGSFSVQVSYELHGGGVGSGSADIGESIYVHNETANPLDFHFYQYSDFNLLNDPNGDTITMDNGSAYQYKGANQIAEGIIDPNASHFEANTTGGPNSTLAKFGSQTGLVLSDATDATGDVTWAYQWDVTIGANGGPDDLFAIVKDKALSIQYVPEPTALSLLGLGLGALALRRRKAA